MAGNSIGTLFRVTTFGESHGKAIGVVIDGVPAGLPLSVEDIYRELILRRPGHRFATSRAETDYPEIISGVFRGVTCGSPVTIVVWNRDVDSSPYEELKYTPRPGHADLQMMRKYGFDAWDYRGGGRASGRETVARVAAGAVAKKLLCSLGIIIVGYLRSVGRIRLRKEMFDLEALMRARLSPVKTFDPEFEKEVMDLIDEVRRRGDSVGGCVEAVAFNVPPGLGDPVFDKLKADIAKAVMSIPGTVGVEFGLGIGLSEMYGSEANDALVIKNGYIRYLRNVQGGIVGGISTGEPIIVRVYFKPTSSIAAGIHTVDIRNLREVHVKVRGRHDPCIAIRAVPVVESMLAIVLVDHAMRCGLISTDRLTLREVRNIEENWRLYIQYGPPLDKTDEKQRRL
ncbi:MAG: chorismate synthase [Crenarchaeota archaeon]|nr:chorismate synthase [Thermoproteota archaeon]